MANNWPYSGAITPIGVEIMPNNWPNDLQDALESLGAGGGRASVASAVAAAELTLPNNYDCVYSVSGTTAIKFIDSTGRQPTNTIILVFEDNNMQIQQGQSSPSDPKFLPIYYNGASSLSSIFVRQRSHLVFVNMGTYWSTNVGYA